MKLDPLREAILGTPARDGFDAEREGLLDGARTDAEREARSELLDRLSPAEALGHRCTSRDVPGRALAASRRQPWSGYDSATVGEQVKRRLADCDTHAVHRVRLYEQRHKRRKGVLGALDVQARRLARERRIERGS